MMDLTLTLKSSFIYNYSYYKNEFSNTRLNIITLGMYLLQPLSQSVNLNFPTLR